MLQFGFRPLSNTHTIDDVENAHVLVYLGLGSQYGVGECILPKHDLNSLLEKETFIQQQLMRYVFNGPERFWHFLHHLIPQEPHIIRAIDIASWDLWGKVSGKSVHHLFNDVDYQAEDYSKAIIALDQLGIISSNDDIEKLNTSSYDHIYVAGDIDLELLKSTIDFDVKLWYSSDSMALSSSININPLIEFDKTQGISDLLVHHQKYNFKEATVLTRQGSILTTALLTALNVKNIIANHWILNHAAMYKNLIFTEAGELNYIDDKFHGHGVLV